MDFNRRDFLKIGMLTASAMTFTACGRPVEHGVVSQYQMPEYKLLGAPSFWASTCSDLRSDCAVSVKTVENRAIQVMGLPYHFFSKGYPTSAAISTLNVLYHPARLQKVEGFAADKPLGEQFGSELKKSGSATVFVVDRLCGSAGDALVEIAKSIGGKIWVADSQQSVRERRILKAVTGRAELPLADLENHDFVLTVGSNLLQENYAPTRTEWAYGRFRKTPGRIRGKMVSVSSRMNSSDANADIWMPVVSGSESAVLGAIGKLLGERGKSGFPKWASIDAEEAAKLCRIPQAEVEHFVENLEKLADRLVDAHAPLVVGGFQGANGDATVFLAHTITKMLNGDVKTFEPDALVGTKKSGAGLFLNDSEVGAALSSAKVAVVDSVDLVYRFPWLAGDFEKAKKRIVLSTMPSETTAKASHLVPLRTWMEDWADLLVKSPEGDWYGLCQPVVRNQVGAAVSRLGLLLEVAGAAGAKVGSGETSARKFLQGDKDQGTWEDMLIRGGHWEQEDESVYPHAAAYPPPVAPNVGSAPSGYSIFADLEKLDVTSLGTVPQGTTFVVLPTHLGDGEMSDRPWMQELPDAMTTVVWDSWVEINEEWAKSNGIERHDIVEVTVGGASIKGSAYPSPFIHPECVGIPSGRGQSTPLHESVAKIGWISSGSNPKKLLDGKAGAGGFFPSSAANASVKKGSGSRLLATFDQRVYNLPRHILPE